MTMSEEIALAAIFDFGQAFVFMKLKEQTLVVPGTLFSIKTLNLQVS